MRFCTNHHRFHYGIDLHARSTYVCTMNHKVGILLHRSMTATHKDLAKVIDLYLKDIVLHVECIFRCHWAADLCHQFGVEFVLGYTL